jgi:hypothetical protein
MMAPDERSFRALLRWYPRRWRERNERVVLGTMLDDAEARGQRIPDASMRRAAIVQGLGARLDRRTAIVAASLAVALGFAGMPLLFTGGGSIWLIVGFGVAPFLMLSSIAATLRTRGLLSGLEALAALSLALPATAFSTLATLSLSVGFDEADAGITRGWFTQAFIWFAAVAWFAATASGAVVVGGMLRALAISTVWARVGGAALTGVAYPFLAITLMNPASGTLLALASLGAAILLTRPMPVAGNAARSAASAEGTPRVARVSVLICALVSTVAGAASVVFALTGSGWIGGAMDSTEAMRAGIVAGFVSALPYCVAIGLMRAQYHRPIHAWGPPTLIALALLIAATENVIGNGDGNRIVWALMIAALPLGGAVAWMIVLGRWASRVVRTTIAALCGASVLMIGLAIQTLPFVLPIAALILAVGEARRLMFLRTRRARPPRAAAA